MLYIALYIMHNISFVILVIVVYCFILILSYIYGTIYTQGTNNLIFERVKRWILWATTKNRKRHIKQPRNFCLIVSQERKGLKNVRFCNFWLFWFFSGLFDPVYVFILFFVFRGEKPASEDLEVLEPEDITAGANKDRRKDHQEEDHGVMGRIQRHDAVVHRLPDKSDGLCRDVKIAAAVCR